MSVTLAPPPRIYGRKVGYLGVFCLRSFGFFDIIKNTYFSADICRQRAFPKECWYVNYKILILNSLLFGHVQCLTLGTLFS